MPAASSPVVLIVDDDENTRIIGSAALTAAGFRVCTAPTGEEGLTMARREPPSLILMDELMPGMLGSEVVRELKADRLTADICIVALTAIAPPDRRRRLLDAGCVAVLMKPILPRALIDAVRRHLKAS